MGQWGRVAGLAALLCATSALAQPKPDEAQFRAIYKEMVETNSSVSGGGCTKVGEQVAARMKAAGFTDEQLTVFIPPGHPNEGGLVAIYPGTNPKAKAILLVAHEDVVEAKREDWTRDPYTLYEENGYFMARGASDDKAQAAIWADMLIRFKQTGYKPVHTLKLALTCGEEGAQLNGARWLAQNKRELIDAAFALNEGGGGNVDEKTNTFVSQNVMVGEKSSQGFIVEVTNPGGHSSRPVPDNAIYRLSHALERIEGYRFPVMFNDGNRGYFTAMAKLTPGPDGAAMAAIVANPNDKAADDLLSANPSYNRILRTTCVATTIEGGHAANALPQRARAGINCRVMPGVPVEETQAVLVKVINDPEVKVYPGGIAQNMTPTPPQPPRAAAPSPKLTPGILGPIQKVSNQMWPGVPVVPWMEAGATDGKAMNEVGIPTYGVSGLFFESDMGRIHGLNESIRVKSVMDGREFLTRLVKIYADQKSDVY